MPRAVSLLAALLLGAMAACSAETPANLPPPLAWETSSLVVETASGAYRFDVEIADDAAERERGLMYRTEMAADAGMLFLYDAVVPLVMWMENTVLPLDIVFIGPDGVVVSVAEGAVPYSRDFIRSVVPAKAVLEVNAGVAVRLGIAPGSLVRHAAFGNQAP